jgi:hypothetical protein
MLDEKALEARAARKAAAKAAKIAREAEGIAILDKYEQELGDDAVAGVQTERGIVVVRRPKPSEMAMYMDVARSDKASPGTKREAQEKLARYCVIYPERDAYEAIVKEFALVPTEVHIVACQLADQAEAVTEGK